jgi:hypothetical protein
MAAGGDFTLIPQIVEPLEPVYNTIITQSESAKKEYLNLAAIPTEQFRLTFKALSDTEMATLRTHFKDNNGGYHSFIWKSVPSYIDSGSNKTGRWINGSLKITSVVNKYWNCEITFETAI